MEVWNLAKNIAEEWSPTCAFDESTSPSFISRRRCVPISKRQSFRQHRVHASEVVSVSLCFCSSRAFASFFCLSLTFRGFFALTGPSALLSFHYRTLSALHWFNGSVHSCSKTGTSPQFRRSWTTHHTTISVPRKLTLQTFCIFNTA